MTCKTCKIILEGHATNANLLFSVYCSLRQETKQKETSLKSVVCEMKGASTCIEFCTQNFEL